MKRTLCDVGGLPQLSERDNLGYADPPYGSSSAPINCPDVEDADIWDIFGGKYPSDARRQTDERGGHE